MKTKLDEIRRELRNMIVEADESVSERQIHYSLIYLDCASQNIIAENEGLKPPFIVVPQMVVRTNYND